jgi:hypothetical protein
LAASQLAWKRAVGIGNGGDEPLRLHIDKNDFDFNKLAEPKEGQFDPTGAPHVGGGTWMGGTGGYNTAGMGGVGGPYRLDLGNQVYQLPDSAKAQVPEEIRQKVGAL